MTYDYQMLLLNSGSAAVLAKTFLTEDLKLDLDMDVTKIAGLLVLLSILALNVVKMRREHKATIRENSKK